MKKITLLIGALLLSSAIYADGYVRKGNGVTITMTQPKHNSVRQIRLEIMDSGTIRAGFPYRYCSQREESHHYSTDYSHLLWGNRKQ